MSPFDSANIQDTLKQTVVGFQSSEKISSIQARPDPSPRQILLCLVVGFIWLSESDFFSSLLPNLKEAYPSLQFTKFDFEDEVVFLSFYLKRLDNKLHRECKMVGPLADHLRAPVDDDAGAECTGSEAGVLTMIGPAGLGIRVTACEGILSTKPGQDPPEPPPDLGEFMFFADFQISHTKKGRPLRHEIKAPACLFQCSKGDRRKEQDVRFAPFFSLSKGLFDRGRDAWQEFRRLMTRILQRFGSLDTAWEDEMEKKLLTFYASLDSKNPVSAPERWFPSLLSSLVRSHNRTERERKGVSALVPCSCRSSFPVRAVQCGLCGGRAQDSPDSSSRDQAGCVL